MEDFYSVLGVSRDASQEEVQRAYREKAKEWHPDVSERDGAEERFKRIKKAYEVLSDEEKRRQYDRLGHRDFERAEKHGGADRAEGFGGFSGFGTDGVGDIFDMFFGGGGSDRQQRGRDLKTGLKISLEEAFHGTEKEVTYRRRAPCPECDGTGAEEPDSIRTCPECGGSGVERVARNTPQGRFVTQTTCRSCGGEGETVDEPCPKCGGRGRVRERKTVTVDVPPGVRDGQTLTLRNMGEAGEKGAPGGDLHVAVSVEEGDGVRRRGDDLHLVKPITFPQAVFGDEVEVETLDGTLKVEVEPGTQSGEALRLRGKGMPRLRGRGRGDLFVNLQVVTPEPGDLDGDAAEALRAFSEETGNGVEPDEGLLDRVKRRVLG